MSNNPDIPCPESESKQLPWEGDYEFDTSHWVSTKVLCQRAFEQKNMGSDLRDDQIFAGVAKAAGSSAAEHGQLFLDLLDRTIEESPVPKTVWTEEEDPTSPKFKFLQEPRTKANSLSPREEKALKDMFKKKQAGLSLTSKQKSYYKYLVLKLSSICPRQKLVATGRRPPRARDPEICSHQFGKGTLLLWDKSRKV